MRARALLPLALLAVAGCAVTGNPREGGLFGWSESMARDRVAERRSQVVAADAQVAREQQRGAATSQRVQAVKREEAGAAQQRDRTLQNLANREAAVSAKAAQLEAESPTPATASRAHRLRAAVEATRRNEQLSPEARSRELRRLEIEIDEARASLRR